MNALADDPEFQKYLLGNIPVSDVQAAFERYNELRGLGTSFDLWFTRINQNAGVMTMLRQLYEYDMLAKANKEVYVMGLRIKKRISSDPAKNLTTPITTNEIVDFYQSLSPSRKSIDGITKSD